MHSEKRLGAGTAPHNWLRCGLSAVPASKEVRFVPRGCRLDLMRGVVVSPGFLIPGRGRGKEPYIEMVPDLHFGEPESFTRRESPARSFGEDHPGPGNLTVPSATPPRASR